MIGGGAAFGYLIAKLAAPAGPMASAGIGAAKASVGADPFAELAAEHRQVLSLIDEMRGGGKAQQLKGFVRLKRDLSKHALAEEDVVYPLLREKAHSEVEHLFAAHAQMKIALAEIEERLQSDQSIEAVLQSLRGTVAAHASDEEEREFPKLREALDKAAVIDAAGKIAREKALLI